MSWSKSVWVAHVMQKRQALWDIKAREKPWLTFSPVFLSGAVTHNAGLRGAVTYRPSPNSTASLHRDIHTSNEGPRVS